MKVKKSMVIRPAVVSDAADLSQIHFEAISRTAHAFYPSQVIASWAQAPDERRREQFRSAIVGTDELLLVADSAGEILGFGSIIPSTGELRAVYVHPDAGRSGVGSALLRELEQLARVNGLSELHMDASLNAEAFYTRHGYEVIARGSHRLAGGEQMACVSMRKAFDVQNA